MARRVVRDPVLAKPEPAVASIAVRASVASAPQAERRTPGQIAARASLLQDDPSPSSETRNKDVPACKDRPDSRKARGGKGGSRPFVPWCDRRR